MEQEINAALAGIGTRLRSIRAAQGMTLRELAEATDISESTLLKSPRSWPTAPEPRPHPASPERCESASTRSSRPP
ncbi:MAG: helix-turn-helix domain-containing protein [Ilumatobacteraceae bacterium]